MDLRDRLSEIMDRMDRACRRSGREMEEVTLLGATKTVGPETIRKACEAGLELFGENRVQEAVGKIEALADFPLTWHFIGKLQKNKAGPAIDLFSLIQSVDSASLAERLERVASQKEALVSVLVEVNVGSEITKGGIPPDEVEDLCARITEMEHLTVKGLMAIPPYHPDPEHVRPYFRQLRTLFDGLSGRYRSMEVLSMGMSEDFEVAIEEGSTLVRLGRVLFGERT